MRKILCVFLSAIMLISCAAFSAAAEEEAFSITLEGEKFTAQTQSDEAPAVEHLTDADFSGNGWLKTSSAKEYSMTADFYVPEAGFYNVSTVTFPNGGEVYLSEYKITVGGKDYTAGDMAEESGTYPSIFKKYVSKRVVRLEKGKNTITFTPTTLRNTGQAMDYCFCMDYVKLEKTNLGTIRYEGEDLKAAIGGNVPTNGNASGGKVLQVVRAVAQYPNSFDITVDAPAAGLYRFGFSGSGPDTQAEAESKYAIYFKNEKLDLQTTRQTGSAYDLYSAEVELDEGVNAFTVVVEPWTHSASFGTHYVLYCDYYEITMLSESEPASKIVIEAEKGYEVQNFTPVTANVAARTLEDLESGNTDSSLMSGGEILVANNNTSIKTSVNNGLLTYKVNIPASGSYSMVIDIAAQISQGSTYSPVKLAVKQGDTKLVNDRLLAAAGTWITSRTWDEETEQAIESKVQITEENATVEVVDNELYYAYGNCTMRRYRLLDKIELEAGEAEITIKCDSGWGNFDWGFFIMDDIVLQRDVDCSALSLKGAEDGVFTGNTYELAAVDNYGAVLDSSQFSPVWTSSNENILTVDGNGVVTAKNPGKATVTLEVEGYTYTKDICVYNNSIKFMIDNVSLDGNTVSVKHLSLAGFENAPVTLIAAAFSADGKTMTEAKTAALGGNDPYMYQTTSITLDAAADKIKLFAWSGLDKPAPAFSAISVK